MGRGGVESTEEEKRREWDFRVEIAVFGIFYGIGLDANSVYGCVH